MGNVTRNVRPNDEVKFGNNSRTAVSWICGPTHKINKQHVPGYTGHVHGLVSENVMGKSFAKSTSTAI